MIRFETREDLAVVLKHALGLKAYQAREWAERIERQARICQASAGEDRSDNRRKRATA